MKTIEQIIDDVFYTCSGDTTKHNAKRLAKDCIKTAQRWVPIEEELPEIKDHGFSDLVLTKNSFGNILLERYDMESESFNAVRYDALKKGDGQVSHWRPIEFE